MTALRQQRPTSHVRRESEAPHWHEKISSQRASPIFTAFFKTRIRSDFLSSQSPSRPSARMVQHLNRMCLAGSLWTKLETELTATKLPTGMLSYRLRRFPSMRSRTARAASSALVPGRNTAATPRSYKNSWSRFGTTPPQIAMMFSAPFRLSSKESVCSECSPPSTTANASQAVRIILLWILPLQSLSCNITMRPCIRTGLRHSSRIEFGT